MECRERPMLPWKSQRDIGARRMRHNVQSSRTPVGAMSRQPRGRVITTHGEPADAGAGAKTSTNPNRGTTVPTG
ncbi:hypothetical protein [Lysobacter gummosus]|uniref:hypothetical protein n=1 Tax=Lysobacter gummosus TaxID=262324 RepID=UPI003640E572